MLVTISGLPGSGTSTVARGVAEALGIERLDGGTVFRALAAERDLSLAAFSKLAETDPTIDLTLDARLAARAREGGVVLESRLAGWIAMNERLDGAKVWLACSPEIRARRVAGRDGLDHAAAMKANEVREASERQRYHDYYGIDIGDLSVYDVVLDSGDTRPAGLIRAILDVVRGFASFGA